MLALSPLGKLKNWIWPQCLTSPVQPDAHMLFPEERDIKRMKLYLTVAEEMEIVHFSFACFVLL